jgi:hypothetical protein
MALGANADSPQDPIDPPTPPGDNGGNGGLIFWEPWKPTPGARVVVRLGGECQVDWGKVGDRTGEYTGHPPEFDWKAGTVFRIDEDYGAHRYAVFFDRPCPVERKGGAPAMGAHFAAIELEPLDLPDTAETQRLLRRFDRMNGRGTGRPGGGEQD